MNMRYAIWAAVSRKEQATPDKLSLPEQETRSRQSAATRGWRETAGPYIIPGASRSFYVNLSDAENDIPQLKQMLEDARSNLFDVLVIYSYDRLGDLVDMIAQSLRFYGKQLYSITQPTEPQDPDHFDPYTSESEAIMRDAARITQRFRINDLRRKYRLGMPARIQRGLTPLRVPFGYKWVGKKEPPALVPQHAALLLQMKTMLLQGKTVADIARYANSTGIPSSNGISKWDYTAIKYILNNSYYAGIVTLHRSVTVRDPRRKNQTRQIDQPRSKWVTGKGTHEPIWDEATHHALASELKRRNEIGRHYAVRYPFSGLLYCSVCNAKLHRHANGSSRKGRVRVLTCATGTAHVTIPYAEGLRLVANELTRQLAEYRSQPAEQLIKPNTEHYQKALDEIAQRRKRIQTGFEAGLYDEVEAKTKLNELQTQYETIQQEIAEAETASHVRQEFIGHIQDLSQLPEWIEQDDPAIVHRLISALCERIAITPSRQVQITWRH